MSLTWPPRAVARMQRCTRCGRLLGTRRIVTAAWWPECLFDSDECLRRQDEGFEAARAAVNGRRAG